MNSLDPVDSYFNFSYENYYHLYFLGTENFITWYHDYEWGIYE